MSTTPARLAAQNPPVVAAEAPAGDVADQPESSAWATPPRLLAEYTTGVGSSLTHALVGLVIGGMVGWIRAGACVLWCGEQHEVLHDALIGAGFGSGIGSFVGVTAAGRFAGADGSYAGAAVASALNGVAVWSILHFGSRWFDSREALNGAAIAVAVAAPALVVAGYELGTGPSSAAEVTPLDSTGIGGPERVALELAGGVLGGLAGGAVGFGAGALPGLLIENEQEPPPWVLTGIIGGTLGFTFGVPTGVSWMGSSLGTGGTFAGALIGTVLGAGSFGTLILYDVISAAPFASDDDEDRPPTSAFVGGGLAMLVLPVVTYELSTSFESAGEGVTLLPSITESTDGGLVLGVTGSF